MKKKLLSIIGFVIMATTLGFSQQRWQINPQGGITWQVRDAHTDHIEMAGEQVATVLRYGVNTNGAFTLERSMIFPMLRTIPNNTHASLMQRFAVDIPSMLIVDGRTLQNEKVKSMTLDGKLTVQSSFNNGEVELTRCLFPSTTKAILIEGYKLTNKGSKNLSVIIPELRSSYTTPAEKGVKGSYTMIQSIANDGNYNLKSGESISFSASVQAYDKDQTEQSYDYNTELGLREQFVDQMWNTMVLQTPDNTINRMFAFSKIRASESIYKTAGGYMHGPGGESYYAAIWANDQAEYVNPFFGMLGYGIGKESAICSYRHFARFMNDQWKPIPSSIIAEGIDIWNGAGDRGDAAMIAYGAARYALSSGSMDEAKELWSLIEWCLEFCHRKINEGGVVASDSDELEGRFPSGKANLCTSTLYYDALISASYLAKELKLSNRISQTYFKQAAELKKNINKYFGATVEGFDTYQYYEGNNILRSWICMPLTVGIYDRAQGTIDALFSPRLWTKDGLLTQAGSTTFWDRSTLYALRGVYEAGYADVATDYMKRYSSTRLLGDHVPYAIEAFPEGNQRHLSAESGLYARIITEGLFGIRPTGLRTFTVKPSLPKEWNEIALRRVNAFGGVFDIEVSRVAKGIEIKILVDGKVVNQGLNEISAKIN